MYVFGGNDGHIKSDLFKFNFKTNTWTEIENTDIDNINQWPKERCKTYASLYKNYMFIYGGNNGNEILDDLWSFDLSKKKIFLFFLFPKKFSNGKNMT